MSPDDGLESLRREFADDIDRRLAELRHAAARGDAGVAQRVAHALTGSARALGLVSLTRALGEVERLLGEGAEPDELVPAVDVARAAAAAELPRHAGTDSGDLVEQLSHDLRTPVGAIVGFSQLLRRTGLADDQERLVAGITAACDRLVSLLDESLETHRRRSSARRAGERAAEQAPAVEPAPVAARAARSALTIVYVEDDPVSVAVLEDLLAARPGVRLVVALTGAEGIALDSAVSPDLVLLDLGLPDIEGDEVLRRLREVAPARPVAVVSGDTRPERIAELRRAGAEDYFAKPVDARQLLELVDQLEHA